MFEKRTLFIIGAGASCEFGLPAGVDLKRHIANCLDIKFKGFNEQFSGSLHIADALRAALQENNLRSINDYLGSAWQIRDAMPQAISIDNYLDAHSGDTKIELCGKLAIAHSILEAEKKSLLYIDHRNDDRMNFARVGETWINSFMQLLTEGVRKSDVETVFKNVSFIAFNYDRCIEQFLIHALRNYYQIDRDTAERIVRQVSIKHPYGTVGRLPWQAGDSPAVDFGSTIGGSHLLRASKNIKTFSERIEDEVELSALHERVLDAEQIVFLGFSFLRQNMNLLTPGKKAKAQRVFATIYGISKSDSEIVTKLILSQLKMHPHEIQLEKDGLKCVELLKGYGRSITA